MKKSILISCAAASLLMGADADLGTITIEEVNTKVIGNVNTKEVKNADLAEALAKKSPSVSLIRRSGIANDIVLRGQKRDNIRVTIDDALVCGACPNRMDPPTSHVITTNVDSVEIKEGPFDVTEMGTLSGGVKIKTARPTKELSGEVSATAGSFGYKKGVISVSGGNDQAQLLVTASKEESDQYEDGDENNFYEQQVAQGAAAGNQYSSSYQNMKAYEKQSIMAKSVVNLDDKSDIELSYTKNQSDNVLYPNTPMDAIYDDSSILNFKYNLKNLNKYSKNLEIRAFRSEVDHPMSVSYRNNIGMMNEMTNHLTTDVRGLKVLNTFDFLDREITYGIDTSKRNWDGTYSIDTGATQKSIDDSDTTNKALFVQCNRAIDKTDLELGLRYDKTDITTARSVTTTDKDRDFNSLSANVFATYNLNDTTKYFFGIGRSYRVPDARELYAISKNANLTAPGAKSQGTDTLNQTQNNEIDLGVQKQYQNGSIKFKAFYSKLKDYIYYNKSTGTNEFENIDATIYGAELNAAYYVNDQVTLDLSSAYKKGKKDSLPTGDTDKDLADIAPLKTTLAMTYDHDDNTYGTIEVINSAKWSNYDSDNGEQEIDGYTVLNLKGQTEIAKNYELTLGIDNLFDKTYAVSNTYYDLTLLSNNTILMNEPGRYVYASLKYKF